MDADQKLLFLTRYHMVCPCPVKDPKCVAPATNAYTKISDPHYQEDLCKLFEQSHRVLETEGYQQHSFHKNACSSCMKIFDTLMRKQNDATRFELLYLCHARPHGWIFLDALTGSMHHAMHLVFIIA